MHPRITYANVTATLALFMALGGSSYAAITITGKNVADSSLTTKDVKDRSLLKRDFKRGQLARGAPGVAGLKGDRGIQGERGASGSDGTNGSDGAPGSALGFAAVQAGGTLYPPPNSKNIDRATKVDFGSPTTGVYCLHTTFPPHNVVASIYGGGSESGEIQAITVTDINCATGDGPYNVQVSTFDSTGAPADRSFYVAVN